jgi:enamine deaminase RidA (YjgF/YER057c/UK114 family)
MDNVIQLPERRSKAVDSPDSAGQIDITAMSPKAIREQISQTMATCRILHETIGALKENLKWIDGVVRAIEDPDKRQELQLQMASMRELLGVKLADLFDIELLLQASLRRVQRTES